MNYLFSFKCLKFGWAFTIWRSSDEVKEILKGKMSNGKVHSDPDLLDDGGVVGSKLGVDAGLDSSVEVVPVNGFSANGVIRSEVNRQGSEGEGANGKDSDGNPVVDKVNEEGSGSLGINSSSRNKGGSFTYWY